MSLDFPLSFLLIPYGLVVVYVLIFSFLNLQHLAHYGTSQGTAKTVATIWFIGSLAIVGLTFGLLQGVDWNHKISVSPPTYSSETQKTFGL